MRSRDIICNHVTTQIVDIDLLITFSFSSILMPNFPPYLVSGTTFRNYIVPNLKEQFLFYINLVSDLFCRAG